MLLPVTRIDIIRESNMNKDKLFKVNIQQYSQMSKKVVTLYRYIKAVSEEQCKTKLLSTSPDATVLWVKPVETNMKYLEDR